MITADFRCRFLIACLMFISPAMAFDTTQANLVIEGKISSLTSLETINSSGCFEIHVGKANVQVFKVIRGELSEKNIGIVYHSATAKHPGCTGAPKEHLLLQDKRYKFFLTPSPIKSGLYQIADDGALLLN